MSNNNEPNDIELKDFFETAANIAATYKIISDGVRYVDNASFWQWMKDSYPRMFENGLQNWMTAHPKSAEVFFQTKGLEWDVFQNYHPHFIDINELSKATNDRVKDLSSFNPFTGDTTIIQVKAPLSESGIREEAKKLFYHYPPETKFAVTQSVYDEAIKRGMPSERFVEVVPDDSVKEATHQRYEAASKNQIDVGLTSEGIIEQIGQGALIGAIVNVGLSTLSNYKNYKDGRISFDELGKSILKDGTKGGIIGGSMAAVNVGVQYGATTLGLGAPVTIPVMLIISSGLRNIVDPIFGDGKYAETLNSMKYSTSIQNGWYDFGILSVSLYEKQRKLQAFKELMLKRAVLLDSLSDKLDKMIEDELNKES